MDLDALLNRSTLANVIAAGVVIVSTCYFVYTKDTDALKWIGGFSLAWIFKEVKQ